MLILLFFELTKYTFQNENEILLPIMLCDVNNTKSKNSWQES